MPFRGNHFRTSNLFIHQEATHPASCRQHWPECSGSWILATGPFSVLKTFYLPAKRLHQSWWSLLAGRGPQGGPRTCWSDHVGWPQNALESSLTSWRKYPGRCKAGCPCSDCCPTTWYKINIDRDRCIGLDRCFSLINEIIKNCIVYFS